MAKNSVNSVPSGSVCVAWRDGSASSLKAATAPQLGPAGRARVSTLVLLHQGDHIVRLVVPAGRGVRCGVWGGHGSGVVNHHKRSTTSQAAEAPVTAAGRHHCNNKQPSQP